MLARKLFVATCVVFILMFAGACADEETNTGPPPPDPLPGDIPELIAMLKEPMQTRSNEIMDALVEKGDTAIPLVIEALENDAEFRDQATFALAKFGEPAVDDLIGALKSQQMQVRYAAIGALGLIGPDAQAAVDPLQDLFQMAMTSERKKIMESIQKITTDSSAVVMVKAALHLEDLRFDAMRTLGKWGQSAELAVPALVEFLSDDYDQNRWEAIDALVKIGPYEGVVEGFARIVSEDPEPRIRKKAAQELGEFGTAAGAATGALAGAMTDADLEVQKLAARSLGKIAPESRGAIPDLITALTASNPQLRQDAALALGKFGAEASSALDALRTASESDTMDYVRSAASQAIASIEGNN